MAAKGDRIDFMFLAHYPVAESATVLQQMGCMGFNVKCSHIPIATTKLNSIPTITSFQKFPV